MGGWLFLFLGAAAGWVANPWLDLLAGRRKRREREDESQD